MKCDYGIFENLMLRDKIISSVSNDAVREKLLTEPILNLTRTILICRKQEIMRKQVQDMKGEEQRKADVIQNAKKTLRTTVYMSPL